MPGSIGRAGPAERRGAGRARDRVCAPAAGRVSAPWARAALALLYLLLNRRYAALQAVTELVGLCDPCECWSGAGAGPDGGRRSRAARRALLRLRDAVAGLGALRGRLTAYPWCERAVLLGLAVHLGDEAAIADLRRRASWGSGTPHLSRADEIVILSGACALDAEESVSAFAPHLERACGGLSLTFVSGGTTSGVSALAGRIAERSGGRIRAFGYLPSSLPSPVRRDDGRYTALFCAPGDDFTPLDPLRGWTDIIAADIDPRSVKLLAYGGGEISRAETAMALALGARAGIVIGGSAAAAADGGVVDAARPEAGRKPIRLPLDAAALRAFLIGEK